MKDYLYDVKLSDTNKKKKALKELEELEAISEDSRARLPLKKYREIRTRERKLHRFIGKAEKGANYE